jgi:hypothetical protein
VITSVQDKRRRRRRRRRTVGLARRLPLLPRTRLQRNVLIAMMILRAAMRSFLRAPLPQSLQQSAAALLLVLVLALRLRLLL